jgi:hypothetical protein
MTTDSRVVLSNLDFARAFVHDMVKRGFISGWFGEAGDAYREEQAQTWLALFERQRPIHINYVNGNANNLHLYCGWSVAESFEYCRRCGYEPFRYELQIQGWPTHPDLIGQKGDVHWAIAPGNPGHQVVKSKSHSASSWQDLATHGKEYKPYVPIPLPSTDSVSAHRQIEEAVAAALNGQRVETTVALVDGQTLKVSSA